jgi:hypothetical protein
METIVTCDHCRARLTAYLDGELADDRGSAVRGHLRACAECRAIAHDEAALRDGLRELPPVDPPASLWANVQARLAAEEMADAERPPWRRTLARWGLLARPATRWAGVAAAAALCAFVAWRLGRAPASDAPSDRRAPIAVDDRATTPVVAASCVPLAAPVVSAEVAPPVVAGDVTAELAADRARVAQSYASAVDELIALADAAQLRSNASDDDRRAFCTRYGELSRAVSDAADEPARAHAYRALVRYLQRVVVRDEVVLAARVP